ncbi:hypothetical protein KAW18_03165 [candidate division WOR-3 bacterium]|nr:hypothetical protein [candidate division WOR-3 bacterium]
MKKTVIFGLLLLFTIQTTGKTRVATPQGRAKADVYGFVPHTVGGVWTVESNFGSYGDANASSTGNPSFDYPGGFGFYYQWEGRLWLGAEVAGTKYVSHCDYGNYEFEPDDGSWAFIGTGVSQSDIVSTFNDWGATFNAYPLGLHITQKAYQWSVPEYGDFIAYEYYIVWDKSQSGVAGSESELNLYVTWCWDADVCEADPTDLHIDDMVSFDGYTAGEWTGFSYRPSPSDEWTITQDGATEGADGVPDQYQIYGDDANEVLISSNDTVLLPRNMSYIYDVDNTAEPGDDEGEGGRCPGYIFGRFIYGPPKDDDQYFTDADGNPARYPLVSTHQWWNWNNDPGTDVDKYNYMTAQHSMSLGYTYLATPFDIGASEFDYRFAQTVGPYTLLPYDTLKLVYVSGVGYGLNGGTDDYYGTGERLGARQVADYAMDAYYMGSVSSDPIHPSAPDEDIHWLVPVPPEVPELHYSASEGMVDLIWSKIAEVTPDPIAGKIDFVGYRVYRSAWRPGEWELLAEYDTTNIQREYTDENATLGIPYYYAVTAFDTDSLESGKSNYMKDEGGAELPLYVRSALGTALDSVQVVPNPYYGSASWEAQYENRITFMYLPQNCRIKIFSLSGDLIREIRHIGSSGDADWDLLTDNEISVSSGLYVYKIEQANPEGTEVINSTIGKLLIMR